MAILECGWRRERTWPCEKPWLEQHYGIWCVRESLPTRSPAGATVQSTSKPLSMIHYQKTEEAYPELNNLKRELEKAQRERDKANLDRDGANLERDQANLERDQAILERDQANLEWDQANLDLNLIKVEREQAQRLRENTENCEQTRSEIEKKQRRQEDFAKKKENKKTTTEPAVARLRPESRMEVDEALRAIGRFNVDHVAQEPMNEGLEAWTSPEPVPYMRNLETNPIRPLMKIALPGLTPSSTRGSQIGRGTSRLMELQESLQPNARENSAREERPLTWRDHPVRSVIIASYKKKYGWCLSQA